MDYFGPVVNRAARVERVGSGGQILITDVVWEMIQSSLDKIPSHVTKDLGTYILRGIETDTHLFEILPSDIAGEIIRQIIFF